ncbi:MAG: C45 family autoproteolytic acyltransferase/hydrolase [Pseudomonadota bacterium]
MYKSLVIGLTAICLFFLYSCVHNSILFLPSGKAYRPADEILEKIYAEKPVHSGNVTKLGDARKEIRDGNILLFLKGTPYEMGFQHGWLLKREIAQGVVPIFANPLDAMPEYRDLPGFIKSLMMKYLEISVYAVIEKHTPRPYIEELMGIADGAGMDYKTIFIANFLSDLKMAKVPEVIGKKTKMLQITPECSDFAASGPATETGKLIIGRNTDYTGQGRWMANQTIFYYQPSGQHAYVKVSTAGMLKCNSAMNEAGMVVGGHFMAFSGGTLVGWSFTIFENEIMRKTTSIKEAVDLLKQNPRGGAFGLMVSDGKTGEAVVVEATAEDIGIRKMQEHTIRITNFATTQPFLEKDILLKYNIQTRDIVCRYERLGELIRTHYGNITPETAAAFMGDHVDRTVMRERPVGTVVGNIINVTSVVFQPSDLLFWVATGQEPACNNPFYGYNLKAELEGTVVPVFPEVLKGYTWRNSDHEKAMRIYMDAFVAYLQDHQETARARKLLHQAEDLAPAEPVIKRVLGQLYIHNGDYPTAERLLLQAIGMKQSNNDQALTLLLLGQVRDLMGKREEAQNDYNRVLTLREEHGASPLSGINDLVYGFAGKFRKEAFSDDCIKDIPVSFALLSGLE